MSYSTDRAAELAQLFERFVSLNAYQLIGHRSNIEFWVTEAAHTLGVLDGYGARFQKMKRAQTQWVKKHDVRVDDFCPFCGGSCEFGPSAPPPPRRVPDDQIDESRRELREGARRFLLRLYETFMLDSAEVCTFGERLGTGFEPEELQREDPTEPPDGS